MSVDDRKVERCTYSRGHKTIVSLSIKYIVGDHPFGVTYALAGQVSPYRFDQIGGDSVYAEATAMSPFIPLHADTAMYA